MSSNTCPTTIEHLRNVRASCSRVGALWITIPKFFGEEVAAAIRPQPGASIDEADVMRFCQERLARFKVPRFVRVVDGFPMTASRKIQKFTLRQDHERALSSADANPHGPHGMRGGDRQSGARAAPR